MESRAKRRAPSLYEYSTPIYAGCGFTIELDHGSTPPTTAIIRHHTLPPKRIKDYYLASMTIDRKLYILVKQHEYAYAVITMDSETGNVDTLTDYAHIPDVVYAQLPMDLTFWVFPYKNIILARTPEGYELLHVNDIHEILQCRTRVDNVYHWRAIPRAYLIVNTAVEIHYFDECEPTIFPVYDQLRVMQHNILIRHNDTAQRQTPITLSDGRYEHTFTGHWLAEVARTLIDDIPKAHYLLGTPEPMAHNSRDGLRHCVDIHLYYNYYHGYDDTLVSEPKRFLGSITIDYAHLPWLYHIMEDPHTYFSWLPRDILNIITRLLLPQSAYVATTSVHGKYRIHGRIPMW